jgi:hypothetical protein
MLDSSVKCNRNRNVMAIGLNDPDEKDSPTKKVSGYILVLFVIVYHCASGDWAHELPFLSESPQSIRTR